MHQKHILVKLLKEIPYDISGVEIGVYEGITSAYLLENLDNLKKLYCVDSWELYEDYAKTLKPGGSMAGDLNIVFETYKSNIHTYENRVKTFKMMSAEAVKRINDESVYFVFIDANHAYEYVKNDILLWMPKVEIGGLIIGHDYGKERFGVTKAVHEIFGNNFKINGSVWYTTRR